MTLGLGNVRALMEALDHPERSFRSIVVAGTNGKGSVTAYLAALLGANGHRVGKYTSPHVYHVDERICINAEPVSVDIMEKAAARVTPLYDEINYSYFEALTAIAFLVFQWQEVEFAVLETGLGGRFDATNVVDPEAAILTGISLDHRRILGDTEEEILREKLGITRPGVPFFCGALQEGLRGLVEARSRREEIPLRTIDDIGTVELVSLSFDGMTAAVRTEKSDYGTVPLPFIGKHQLDNALLAVAAAEHLIGSIEHFEDAAAMAYVPGRFDRIPAGDKTVILDVAHNDASLIATAKTLADVSDREENAMVLGILRRKELQRFPSVFSKWINRLYLIDPVPDDTCTAPELLARFGLDAMRRGATDVVLKTRWADTGELDRFIDGLVTPSSRHRAVLITGSHHVVELFGRRLLQRGVL